MILSRLTALLSDTSFAVNAGDMIALMLQATLNDSYAVSASLVSPLLYGDGRTISTFCKHSANFFEQI